MLLRLRHAGGGTFFRKQHILYQRVTPEVMRLRRCGKKPSLLAAVAIALGVLILMAKLLPPVFWWFLVAAGLIILGIWLLRE